MGAREWKQHLEGELPAELAREIDIFEKQIQLRREGKLDETLCAETRVRRGVYGVPTFAVRDELFWGADLTDMLLDYLADPKLFSRGEMARIDSMPMGVERS